MNAKQLTEIEEQVSKLKQWPFMNSEKLYQRVAFMNDNIPDLCKSLRVAVEALEKTISNNPEGIPSRHLAENALREIGWIKEDE